MHINKLNEDLSGLTMPALPEGSRDGLIANSVASITTQDVAELPGVGDEPVGAPTLAPKEENTVLQKLQKWADYDSFGEPVEPTRFIPMKTPMSSEIVNNWSLEEPPKHVLTISSLLEEERAKGREIGLIIDLSNHETLYAEDLTTALNVQYAHIQLVAKMFPGKASIMQVMKTARTFWDKHPTQYIAIHCAYGFNRTGFVVCAYLVLVCGLSVQEALANFAVARPPGVKHEKFIVELYRRYGTRRMSISHPIPVQQQAPPARDAQDQAAAQAGAFADCSVAGRSPDSDISASQYSATSGSGRLIRLYPDEPLEPGTPSNESTMATQQLWDALQRGRATAYRVRAASELSVAGSDMGGGRLSEDDQGYSMDGRFSCSSLYSEFGHVASHLEERHPGVVLARTSMRPPPPRSVTPEASALSELPPGRTLEDASLQLLSQHRHGLSLRHSGDPIAARQDAQTADAASDLAARLPGGAEQSSAGTSREATRHGQQLNAWVENDAERPLESSSAPASLKEQKPATQAAGDDRPLLNHSHLNGGGHHLAEELSVQHTSNSNSSLGGESACSLVNNDSLGLDERGIFKQFDERNRSRERRGERRQAARAASKLTLQDIRSGAAAESLSAEGSAAAPGRVLSTPVVQPDTPFANASIQENQQAETSGKSAEGSKRCNVARKLFFKHSQRGWRTRCRMM